MQKRVDHSGPEVGGGAAPGVPELQAGESFGGGSGGGLDFCRGATQRRVADGIASLSGSTIALDSGSLGVSDSVTRVGGEQADSGLSCCGFAAGSGSAGANGSTTQTAQRSWELRKSARGSLLVRPQC